MKTAIAMVLDRSGSMESIAADTIGGVNTFLTEQKRVPDPATFTLAQFDNVYEVVFEGPVAAMPLLTPATFVPRGSTALLDAIGRTIDTLGGKLATMLEADRPGKVIVVIVTDGHENASQTFTRAQVDQMITHQRDVYKWEFVYLGANQDAIDVAGQIGIPMSHAVTYTANAAGTRNVLRSVSSKVADYRTDTNLNATFVAFTPDERDEAVAEE
jgi:hypothetical protein